MEVNKPDERAGGNRKFSEANFDRWVWAASVYALATADAPGQGAGSDAERLKQQQMHTEPQKRLTFTTNAAVFVFRLAAQQKNLNYKKQIV